MHGGDRRAWVGVPWVWGATRERGSLWHGGDPERLGGVWVVPVLRVRTGTNPALLS